MMKPRIDTIRKGAMVKAVTPVRPSLKSWIQPNLLIPATRGAAAKGIIAVRNPTQAYRPFMKRLRSGMALMASTTLRLSRRKSPASGGMTMELPVSINR